MFWMILDAADQQWAASWKGETTPDTEEVAMDWIVKVAKSLVQALTDPYRPELHYMRGPGPKWRTKHPAGC